MAKAASVIASDIQAAIQTKGKDVATFTWPEFYKIAARDRIKDAFMEALEKELLKKSLLMVQGNSVVIVGKDFNFAPIG